MGHDVKAVAAGFHGRGRLDGGDNGVVEQGHAEKGKPTPRITAIVDTSGVESQVNGEINHGTLCWD
jgi:hypothetical protein